MSFIFQRKGERVNGCNFNRIMSKNDEATCSVNTLHTIDTDNDDEQSSNNKIASQPSDDKHDVVNSEVLIQSGNKKPNKIILKKGGGGTATTEMMPKLTSIQLPASIKVTKLVQTKTPENKLVFVKILSTAQSAAVPLTVSVSESNLPVVTTTAAAIIKPITPSVSFENNESTPKLKSETDDKTADVVTATNDENTEEDSLFDATASSTPKISREMKELNKMMNQSKILTEFINEPQQQRKSRKSTKPIADYDEDTSSTQHHRRSRSRSKSTMSQYSESNLHDELMSDGGTSFSRSRRSMRSQNLEFAQKQQKFLSRIQHNQDSDGTYNSEDDTMEVSPSKSGDGSKSGNLGAGSVSRARNRKDLKEICPPPKV